MNRRGAPAPEAGAGPHERDRPVRAERRDGGPQGNTLTSPRRGNRRQPRHSHEQRRRHARHGWQLAPWLNCPVTYVAHHAKPCRSASSLNVPAVPAPIPGRGRRRTDAVPSHAGVPACWRWPVQSSADATIRWRTCKRPWRRASSSPPTVAARISLPPTVSARIFLSSDRGSAYPFFAPPGQISSPDL